MWIGGGERTTVMNADKAMLGYRGAVLGAGGRAIQNWLGRFDTNEPVSDRRDSAEAAMLDRTRFV